MQKKIGSLILLFILNLGLSYPQTKIDSLSRLINSSHYDTTRVNLLSELAGLNLKLGNFREGKNNALEIIKISKIINYQRGIALGYRHYGTVFLRTGDFKNALIYYNKSKSIFEKINEYIGVAGTLNNIGLVYYQEGAYHIALQYLLDVKQIHETKHILPFAGPVYNNIGVIYQDINNPDKALEYYKLAMKYYEMHVDISATLINIGNIYLFKNKLNEAETEFNKALEINTKYGNKAGISACLFGIGNLKSQQRKYEISNEYQLKAKKIREEIEDAIGIVECFNAIGYNYLKLKQFNLSEDFLKKAITNARLIKYPAELIKSYEYYSMLDSARNDFKSSLNWYKKYKSLSDSLFNDKVNKDIIKSEIKFEFDKKEQQLLKQKLEDSQKITLQQKYLFVVVIFLIIAISIVLIYFRLHKQKEKLNKSLEEKIRERTEQLLLAKEKAETSEKLKTEFLSQMSHEIRTPLNTIINLAGVLITDFKLMNDEEIKEIFLGINRGGKRIIRTIELILSYAEIMTKGYVKILQDTNLSQLIKRTISECSEIANEKDLTVNYENKSSNCTLSLDEYSVSNIIRNIIENAFIFTEKGRVDITLYQEDNFLTFECIDTGIGISDEHKDKIFSPFYQEDKGYQRKYEGNGIGLALSKKYAELNNAEISFNSQKNVGTKFIVRFPKT